MTQTTPFPNLQGQQYASLSTFRKSGDAVATPVWFALEGDKLYIVTMMKAGKTKRIRNNPRVQLAPCTSSGKLLGPSVDGTARVLSEREGVVAHQALLKKYGLFYRAFGLLWSIQRNQTAYLEVSPA
jgi:uncharacterized protein